MIRRSFAPGAAAFGAATLVALLGLYANAETPTGEPPPRGPVTLRLLGVNDLHGHLEPPRPGVGGVAWLDAALDRAALAGRTIRVHAGDMVGTSPLVSSWFHDEPAIEAANEIGFDVGTVGNHEFDEGGEELLRLLRGGRRGGPRALKRDAAGELVNTSSPSFGGARFPYVAANTLDREGRLVLPPYAIVERAGARVGFIGVTTTSTPKFLLGGTAGEFRFADVSDAVDRWVPELRRQGVEAIVVLAHEGAPAQDESAAPRPTGPILEEALEMSDAVDVVIAGHSHSRLDVRLPNRSGRGEKLVIEALSYGVAFDRVDITIDPRTGHVLAKSAEVVETGHASLAPDRELGALVEGYARRVAPLGDRVVGEAAGPLTRANDRLGQLAADAQRAYAGADVALVSPVTLRGDLDAGPIAYAELFAALAWDHRVLRVRMRGRELARALERFRGYVSGVGDPAAIDPRASYRVAASELTARSASLPAAVRSARVRVAGSEVEALASHLSREPAAPQGRMRAANRP